MADILVTGESSSSGSNDTSSSRRNRSSNSDTIDNITVHPYQAHDADEVGYDDDDDDEYESIRTLLYEFVGLGSCKEIKYHEKSLAIFLVTQHHSAFWFCLQTGVLGAKRSLLLKATDFHENSYTIRAYKAWYFLLRVTLWTQTIFLAWGVVSSDIKDRLMFLALTLESICLNVAVLHCRMQFRARRKIMPDVYKAAFDTARKKANVIFFLVAGLSLLHNILNIYVDDNGHISYEVDIIYVIVTFLVSVTFTGIIFLLILEQLINKHEMEEIEKLAQTEALTLETYLRYQKQMETRDKNSPINFIMVGIMLTTVLAIIVLFYLANKSESVGKNAFNVCLVFSAFGSQYIVLMTILFEIADVNKVAERMVRFSICLSINLSTFLSLYLSCHLSIHLSIDLYIHLSIHLCIHLSIHLFIHLSIYLSIHRAIHLSIYISMHLSIYLCIYLSI